MDRNAGRARARKGERKDIIYIYIYMQISFLFSYISYLEIYCMYVYVDRELVGHEDIEQNLNALLPQFPETGGIFLHTISDTLPMCVRARVCVCGRFCSRRSYLITLSLGGISLRSLNSPWGFRFPKRPFWKSSTQTNIGRGQSTPILCHFP